MEKVAVFGGCNDQNLHIINGVHGYLCPWSLDAVTTKQVQLGQRLPGEQGQEEAQVKCPERQVGNLLRYLHTRNTHVKVLHLTRFILMIENLDKDLKCAIRLP